jgi:hypothetical protein
MHIERKTKSVYSKVFGSILLLSALIGAVFILPKHQFETSKALAAGPNDFFNSLISRPDLYRTSTPLGGKTYSNVPRAYSLRPVPGRPITDPYYEHQFNWGSINNPGYMASGALGQYVFYDYANDINPNRQDAARMWIPPFEVAPYATLAQPVGPTDTSIQLTPWSGGAGSLANGGRTIKIDGEIMTVSAPVVQGVFTIPVNRGRNGSTATSHSAGTNIYIGRNDLVNYINLPINTRSGTDSNHTYLYTWDFYPTSSYVGVAQNGLANLKWIYFQSNNSNVFILPELHFDAAQSTVTQYKPADWNPLTQLGFIALRTSNNVCTSTSCPNGNTDYTLLPSGLWFGPGVTQGGSFTLPVSGTFGIYPNRWNRVFVKIEQRWNDYDYLSIWIGDEQRTPVKIFDSLPMSLDGDMHTTDTASPNNVERLSLGFDSSNSTVGRNANCNLATYQIGVRNLDCDLDMYMRNFVVLEDPADINSLVTEKPLAGVDFITPPPPAPLPPPPPPSPTPTPTPPPSPTPTPPTGTVFYASSGDGSVWAKSTQVSTCSSTDWSQVRNATSGSGATYSATNPSSAVGVYCLAPSNGMLNYKTFLSFDTSALPDDAVISSAKLHMYVTTKSNQLNDGSDFISVVEGTQASTTSLSNSDYSKAGNVEGSNRVDITNINMSAEQVWDLNGSGISWVSKTGYTKLALKEGHDILNSYPALSNSSGNTMSFHFSEQTGTSQDPFLEISYSTASTNTAPLGSFDEIRLSDGVVRGWSLDPDNKSVPNQVHIYIDGPAGSGGTLLAAITTDFLRSDVNINYGASGNHGFEYIIPSSFRNNVSHSIYVYGIDLTDPTKSTLLSGSPKSFTLTSTTLVGDINKDGIVNSLDWSTMNSKWGTSDSSSDLNKDGIVNSIDFSLLNNNWFKTS